MAKEPLPHRSEAHVVDEQLEFVRLVVSRLDAAGIACMLTGSMAMSV